MDNILSHIGLYYYYILTIIEDTLTSIFNINQEETQ